MGDRHVGLQAEALGLNSEIFVEDLSIYQQLKCETGRSFDMAQNI